LIAFETRYAAPPTAIRYTALCCWIASIATGAALGLADHADEAGLRQHRVA
jgi:hypothetical protein